MTIPNETMESAIWGENRITPQELDAARQTVRRFPELSRSELARTICEHWGWEKEAVRCVSGGTGKIRPCLSQLRIFAGRPQVLLLVCAQFPMMFRVDGHPVIVLAACDRVPRRNGVVRWIDLGNLIRAAQIDVDLSRDGIVLRHSGFAVEV